jgi:hypothetical protein
MLFGSGKFADLQEVTTGAELGLPGAAGLCGAIPHVYGARSHYGRQ